MGIFRSLFSIGFAVSVVSAIAVPSNGAALQKRDACSVGPGWASVLNIGSGGSDSSYVSHCETQFGGDYTPISGIEVWEKGDGSHIAGIQFTYASGIVSALYGIEDTSSHASVSLTLAPGEIIKNAVLYGDGNGNWLGHIHLETSKGQIFDAGKDTSGINPYSIQTGSGLLLGAVLTTHDGGNGDNIAKLGWRFLGQAIDHVAVNDVKFTADPSGTASGISPKNIVLGQWYNSDSNNVGYSLSPTYTVSSSYSYSQSVTTSFGGSIGIEFSGELFGIGAKGDDTFTWGVSEDHATTTGTSSTTAVACVATGTLGPNQAVKVTGSYQTGNGDWDYTSTVVVYLKDGTSYTYGEKGKFNNVAFNQCDTIWEPVTSGGPPVGSGLSAVPTSSTASSSSSSAQQTSSSAPASSFSTPSSTAQVTASSTLQTASSTAPITTSSTSQSTLLTKASSSVASSQSSSGSSVAPSSSGLTICSIPVGDFKE